MSLFESGAIAEYLDEMHRPRLHPEDPVGRATNRAWIEYLPTFVDLASAHAYADNEADYDKAAEQIPVPFGKLEKARWNTKGTVRFSMDLATHWSMQPMRPFCSATCFWSGSAG